MCSNCFDGIINRIGIFQQCFPLFWGQWYAFFAWFQFAVLFVKFTATPYNRMRRKTSIKNSLEIFSFDTFHWVKLNVRKELMAYRMSMYVFPLKVRTVTWRLLPKSNLYSPSSVFFASCFAFLAGVRWWGKKPEIQFNSIPLHNQNQ